MVTDVVIIGVESAAGGRAGDEVIATYGRIGGGAAAGGDGHGADALAILKSSAAERRRASSVGPGLAVDLAVRVGRDAQRGRIHRQGAIVIADVVIIRIERAAGGSAGSEIIA